jgi:hypothetical protein
MKISDLRTEWKYEYKSKHEISFSSHKFGFIVMLLHMGKYVIRHNGGIVSCVSDKPDGSFITGESAVRGLMMYLRGLESGIFSTKTFSCIASVGQE